MTDYISISHVPGPDVLTAPIFILEGEPERASLAGILARLLAGPDIWGFPNLTAEQRSYWWRFLVRCAAKALHALELSAEAAARRELAVLTEEVTRVLREAAGGSDAWLLYQLDPALPGFLQPPTPDSAGPEAGYARNTASILTTVVGSKNHERKYDAARSLTSEQTVYALVEYQTGAVFGGRGNYGSQLMGSAAGMGSGTPFMGARLGTRGLSQTFRHDVTVMLRERRKVAEENGLRGSVWALWAEPWDGEAQLPAQRLDPMFVPLARLVRLGPPTDGRVDTVWFRPSNAARVKDHSEGGVLGDTFAPLVRKGDAWKVRGTMGWGYHYTEVARILGLERKAEARASASVRALRDAGIDDGVEVRIVFEGTAFEQGKTGGFHRREVLIPNSYREDMDDLDPARLAHERMLAKVKEAEAALRAAARVLLAGDPRPRRGDDDKVAAMVDALDARVDAIYLDALLTAAARERGGDTGYAREWAERLSGLALEVFFETRDALPTAGARRFERHVHAEARLRARLRKMRGDDAPTAPVRSAAPTLPEEVYA